MKSISKRIFFHISTIIFIIQSLSEAEAQNNENTSPSVKLSGMVKTDIFFDTRQTIAAREGHFLLFPANHLYDNDGKDANSKSSFNILPIQSILSVSINGPATLGASLSGLIEGDFFGGSNNDVNMLRLRHAYLKLQWPKFELLVGQYWHPLFVTSCYPGTISFNTGAPIQPFSRAPQIKISYIPRYLRLSATILSQRDYASVGPEGVSSKYLRDSDFPEIQLSGELMFKNKNEFIIGATLGYKCLVPQTKTGKGYKTSENVNGKSFSAYLKHISKYVTFKLEGIYLENGSEYLTLSGYAVKDSINVEKGFVSYIPMKTVSYWCEINTNGKFVKFGLFTGYTENLGTGARTEGPFYLMSNMPVRSLYRISPRIIVIPGTISFAFEVEHTQASYGTANKDGYIANNSHVNNTRFLLSAMYKF